MPDRPPVTATKPSRTVPPARRMPPNAPPPKIAGGRLQSRCNKIWDNRSRLFCKLRSTIRLLRPVCSLISSTE